MNAMNFNEIQTACKTSTAGHMGSPTSKDCCEMLVLLMLKKHIRIASGWD